MLSSTGQNVASPALGATSSLTTTSGTNVAAFGNDGYADPPTAVAYGRFANGACSSGADAWTVTFPGTVNVSSVIYVNRVDTAALAKRVNT